MSLERKSNRPVHPMPHRNSQLQDPSLDCSRALKIDIRYLPVALLHEEHAFLGSEGARQKISVEDLGLCPPNNSIGLELSQTPEDLLSPCSKRSRRKKKSYHCYIHHRVRYL